MVGTYSTVGKWAKRVPDPTVKTTQKLDWVQLKYEISIVLVGATETLKGWYTPT